MNRRRIIFGYFFGFIMATVLVLLIFLLIIKFTIGNKNYLLNVLNKNNYYQKIDDEIKEEMSLYILSSGFTDEIIDNVYEYDNLVKDINQYIDNAYLGKLTTLDTSSIHDNITKNIDEFFKKSNETYNSNDLKSFINGLVDVYSDEVLLYHFPDSVIKYIPKINKIINIGIIITSILLIVLLIILIKIKYQYFVATIISSGLIILFIRLFVFERVDIDELLVITEKFSEELRIILTNLQILSLNIAVFLIALGIIILIVKLICQLKKRNG